MKGPQGQKRRGDAVGCAVDVAHLATGEAEEVKKEAVALGRRGGKARARNLSREQISAIGRKGAEVRWAGHVKKSETLKT